MKKILFVTLIFLLGFSIKICASRYSFQLIPDELKVGANVVVRTDQMLYTVIDYHKTTKKRKVALTLLNESAEDYRFPEIQYGKFEKVNYIKASVYDEKGQLVEILGSSNILDMSASSNVSFHTDDRVKVIRFPLLRYPYTIEYEYEISVNGLIGYPEWSFKRSLFASVEKSGVQYVVPLDKTVKFWESNIPSKVDSVIVNQSKIYTWQVENLPATKQNPYAGSFISVRPKLSAAPLEFNIDGYKGSSKSWKTFGDWNRKMIEGRDKLPESEIQIAKNLVKNASSEREKIKLIYEYMQSKTRYVSISLGVGGWQPMPASEVALKGYGDCKALTNYTLALLKAVGINSYYTLVLAGDNNDINSKFVSNQFNHVILCVPQPIDTVWLECTSQVLPFNYLSNFTSDRYVLLTTENGGVIARTPSFQNNNVVKRSGTININQISTVTNLEMNTSYSGLYFGESQLYYAQKNEIEISRMLSNNLSLPTFEVRSVAFKEFKSENPKSELAYQLSIRDFAAQSASRLFFTPSIFKTDYLVNDPISIRLYESTVVEDSLVYVLPYGYRVEHVPSGTMLESKFGTFSYEITVSGNKIFFQRRLEFIKGKHSTESFEEFHGFINSIAMADRERVVLKKI
jgi:hypothetical protein